MKNKIGWCNATWNPAWGCLNSCSYCYARGINKRFWAKMLENERNYHFKKHQSWAWTGDQLRNLHDFKPTFLYSQLNKKFPKKPQRIFIGSMSEIYYWKPEWIERVIEKIKQYPQHTFQFLTKFPQVYVKWVFPPNCWLGVTITGEDYLNNTWGQYLLNKDKQYCNNIRFISFEPLLKEIKPPIEVDWVIIGAETGNRKDKVIPNLDWVLEIVRYCKHYKIPIYIKDNLVKYYAECRGYKEFPEKEINSE